MKIGCKCWQVKHLHFSRGREKRVKNVTFAENSFVILFAGAGLFRREFSERFDRDWKVFEQVVDVLVGVFVAQAKADRSAGEFVLAAQSTDDRRRFERP